MDYPIQLETFLSPSDAELPSLSPQNVTHNHSSHLSCGVNKLHQPRHYRRDADWFDVKVFYVRACSCLPDKAPDSLRIVYPQRSISTELDVNGCRICPSVRACYTLRRDRLDTGAAEVTYVSTNSVRVSGVLPFEIYDRDELILHGTLGREKDEDVDSDSVLCSPCPTKWSMDCACCISSVSCHFLKGTVNFSALNPCMEVYVTGRSCGLPLVLTSTVKLFLRKHLRFCSMDVILEDEEDQLDQPFAQVQKVDDKEALDHSSLAMDIMKGFFYMPIKEGYIDGEEMDVSWFNAGVRVGVGIGLGLCLGVAVGVGLLVRPTKRRVL